MNRVRSFILNVSGFDDAWVRRVAMLCHEVNRTFCNYLKDSSQLPWDDSPPWQQDSAINGVMFRLLNPGIEPHDMHNNWMAEKLSGGWKYGATKSPETKEHPCMMPYDDLPKAQQAKDTLFMTVVDTMLKTYRVTEEDGA
jgi:hypothetical protein